MNRTTPVLARVLALVVLILLCAGPLAAQTPTPPGQGGFIPADELPQEEAMPAAPLLVGAYVFVVVALFAYVFSIARRLGVVQREVERLEQDLKRSGRMS